MSNYYENYQLILGDCLEKNELIESGSVDLILTDLPYGNIKGLGGELEKYKRLSNSDWDSTIQPQELFNLCNRILRKNGKAIFFSQEPYTTELVNNSIVNIPFSYRMTWEKDHFANCLFANKAPVSYTEDILVFSKNHDTDALHPLRPYFKQVQDFIGLNKKTIVETIGQKADHTFRTDSTQFSLCTDSTYQELIDTFGIDKMEWFKTYFELKRIDSTFNSTFNLWEGKKYKSNILKYRKDYNGYHPTQKPVALLQDLIKTFSNENDLIVDLTMGSGSCGVASILENRKFIGIEKELNYFEIAQRRISEALNKEPLLNL